MGSVWRKHKYIRVENGRYIYPGNEKQGKQQAQDTYRDMKSRMKLLKQRQIEYENQIDDRSIGDKKKTKSAYKAGDNLDNVLNKIDKLSSKMKQQRLAYKNTFGNKIAKDLHPERYNKSEPKNMKEATARSAELRSQLAALQNKRSEYKSGLNKSNKRANRYYRKSDTYKENQKSEGYQVNGIIGKKYESAGRRYASKINSTDRKIKKLSTELRKLGLEWTMKKMK